MDNQTEIWKDIKGFNGLYKISNLGRVFSCRKNIIMQNQKKSNGYLKVLLVDANGIKKNKYIHRLVCDNFFDVSKILQVNHKNGIKTDNRLDNLELCTPSENQKHSRNVLGNKFFKFPKYFGKNHHSSIKIAQMKDGMVINTFFGCGEAERETNISKANIWMVLKNKRKTAGGYKWKYI